jgi:preprotein translocase subunit SecG
MRIVHRFGICICLLLLVQLVKGQTINEIISKHVAAMGGREKIMSLSSAVMTGIFKATGDTILIPIVTTKKHLVGSRIDIEANNTNNYQIITPKSGWLFTPVQGDKDPRPLAEDQLKSAQVQLDLHGPFINSAEKGYKIEMAGNETVNGTLCYKLKVTAPNANVTVYSIDSKSNFIVKASTKMFQFGAMEDVETTYSDYKKNADGFWFAYTNITPRGKTQYDTILTNVPVDLNIFKTN